MASAKATIRILIAAAVGVVTFIGTMVGNCDDIGGVPTGNDATPGLALQHSSTGHRASST